MGSGTHSYEVNVSMNTWYQVAIARSPLQLKFYVNGQVVSTVPNPNSSHSANGVSFATVAADRTYGALAISKIDDLSIYEVALNDVEIGENYTSLKDIHEVDSRLKVYSFGKTIRYELAEEILPLVESVQLYDMQGRLLIDNLPKSQGIIPYSQISAGTYVITFLVKDSAKPVVRKLTIAE